MISKSMSLSNESICEQKNMFSSVAPFLLTPAGKDYLWGGDRLIKEFGKELGLYPLAESWECSAHRDGVSVVATGEFAGMPLDILLSKYPELLGSHPRKTSGEGQLPILIKLIDAGESASIQVHPDDAYAAEHENGANGKSEMWYVLDAVEDAELIYGFYQDVKKETVEAGIKDGTIEKYLRKVKVKKDDVFYIEPGCVHAIGKGVLIAEIQQNSNITYRLYDYNRRDKDGNLRELHVDKALDVADLKAAKEPRQPMRMLKYKPGFASELLCRCKYFQVERILIHSGTENNAAILSVDKESFAVLLCLEGQGVIEGCQILDFKKGSCIFIPAGCENVKITGKVQLLKIRC